MGKVGAIAFLTVLCVERRTSPLCIRIKLKLKIKFVPKVLQWPKVFHTLCIRKERTAVQDARFKPSLERGYVTVKLSTKYSKMWSEDIDAVSPWGDVQFQRTPVQDLVTMHRTMFADY